jgi:topoisomerase-4 subunit B
MTEQTSYTEDNIRSLDWKEHIRMRPGMYIGKLGDGSSPDDGIYILIKEVLDNSIDEYVMGAGKTIEVTVKDETVVVRDYGRGIPLGKVVDVVSKMNTGGKYDSKAFKKSVGLNGVGTKAVNALSSYFKVQSYRDNQTVFAEFEQGNITLEEKPQESTHRKGTKVSFIPDKAIFSKFKFRNEYIVKMIKNYVYLNTGLTIIFNGEKFYSENGLRDLLDENIDTESKLFKIIHLKGDDIEVAITYSKAQYSEEYHSFVNGQHTTQGGTHQNAFREAIVFW